jgi:hypothetical protein
VCMAVWVPQLIGNSIEEEVSPWNKRTSWNNITSTSPTPRRHTCDPIHGTDRRRHPRALTPISMHRATVEPSRDPYIPTERKHPGRLTRGATVLQYNIHPQVTQTVQDTLCPCTRRRQALPHTVCGVLSVRLPQESTKEPQTWVRRGRQDHRGAVSSTSSKILWGGDPLTDAQMVRLCQHLQNQF